MIPAEEALARLKEGNRRFMASLKDPSPRRFQLTQEQWPCAIILGCSDARVPAEIVFDQGLGDLFVIRVAGNIVAPSQIGSVEFAAAKFNTRLVVVLGHTQCGAIQATLDEVRKPSQQTPGLRSLVERVRPSVETVLRAAGQADEATIARQAVRANVKVSVDHLRHGSELLETLIRKEGLRVVGAKYRIETGEVDFFEEIHD